MLHDDDRLRTLIFVGKTVRSFSSTTNYLVSKNLKRNAAWEDYLDLLAFWPGGQNIPYMHGVHYSGHRKSRKLQCSGKKQFGPFFSTTTNYLVSENLNKMLHGKTFLH